MNVILVEDELSARQNMLAIIEELNVDINPYYSPPLTF